MEFQHLWVYMTTETEEEADRISAALIQERLAACTNVLPGMRSVFQWQGQIEHGQEVVLIAKTHVERFPSLKAKVQELHSYDTPCIVAMPMVTGNEDFLNWISQETQAR
jgi:periplasmic divalent cation tolerance protein